MGNSTAIEATGAIASASEWKQVHRARLKFIESLPEEKRSV
jgi:hypothetical protein